ncbi:tRNA (adenosine(37)-N6)-dimethylallyltransferase MiaA [Demequina zhanjiangensis]|uniref:tRNA dimethylallyltransferase n=1 Tax=Demequina zhanjiangensis TaxID=3051659 RepID=A0ABT8G4K2_9MICO|nr:tRNA (adenosine(37)-N6)-dimethylallyltransferase MiaA [Demequina sp. SYSU T00b26]MDN4473644.1 tRNA (adenosine(37)-N6)-dimethylallyltransferase MiaA [Demequina sp. SYSU T00b26]
MSSARAGASTEDSSAPSSHVIAIVGATATGKSAVSVAMAHLLTERGTPAEIINGDAMQFYRGMDVGTAKISEEERAGVPHHELDWLDVTEDASVARFQERARADIEAIHARGGRAIVVGGSGLYLRALLDVFEFPATDPTLRAVLESRCAVEGPGVLHQELAALDPEGARTIDPRNARRVVRALEVVTLTGEPFGATLPRHEYAIPAVQVGLELGYDVLDPRIESRVQRMWESGLVEEVERLVDEGLREGTTARRAVGYAETLRHLDGEFDAATAQELIAQHTRRLARRQRRWFNPDPRVSWVPAPADAADVERAASEALVAVDRGGPAPSDPAVG